MVSYSVTVIMQEGMPEEVIREQLRQAVEAKFWKISEPTQAEYMKYAAECDILIRNAERMNLWKIRKGMFGNVEVGLTKQGEQCRKADLS